MKQEHKHEIVNYFVIDSKLNAKEIARIFTLGFESRHIPLKNFLFQREDESYIYIYYRIEKEITE